MFMFGKWCLKNIKMWGGLFSDNPKFLQAWKASVLVCYGMCFLVTEKTWRKLGMIPIDDCDTDVSAMEKMVDTLHWMNIMENPTFVDEFPREKPHCGPWRSRNFPGGPQWLWLGPSCSCTARMPWCLQKGRFQLGMDWIQELKLVQLQQWFMVDIVIVCYCIHLYT